MKQGQIFNTVLNSVPQKNVFDLSHDVKLTGNMGNLIPILALECVPGDHFKISADSLIRMNPLKAPVMHRIDVTIHYFFVPNRILWPNWEKWITNQITVDPPTLRVDGTLSADENKFLDYMGVPPFSGTTAVDVCAFPFAGYQKIWNDYYRDQNLITEIDPTLGDGANVPADYLIMRKRAWEHDYYTSALPFAQKGQAVNIPLGDIQVKAGWTGPPWPQFEDTTGTVTPGAIIETGTGAESTGAPGVPVTLNPNGSLEVQSTTINDLRRAFKLQEWLEKNARGGTRYIEHILMHFGVKSSDKRLQRPEYITGTKAPIVISEVLNTTGEVGGLPQGNMAGHAVSVGTGQNKGKYFCEEHGWIIGIMSVMPKTAYQQGIPKSFLKNDPFDYYWKSFAHIGEQEILNNEVYAYTATGEDTFGYIPRYAEYKYMPCRVAGDFRTTLNFWHLGRIFSSLPTLSEEFVEADTTSINSRIFAVPGNDNLYCHVYNKIKAVRPMPIYGNPYL